MLLAQVWTKLQVLFMGAKESCGYFIVLDEVWAWVEYYATEFAVFVVEFKTVIALNCNGLVIWCQLTSLTPTSNSFFPKNIFKNSGSNSRKGSRSHSRAGSSSRTCSVSRTRSKIIPVLVTNWNQNQQF